MISELTNWLHEIVVQKKVKATRRSFRKAVRHKIFDMADLDKAVCLLAEGEFTRHRPLFASIDAPAKNSITVLATSLYDTGGHTACILSLLKSLHGEANLSLVLSKRTKSLERAPTRVREIEKYALIDGLDSTHKNFLDSLLSLYNAICLKAPEIVFAFIHPDDIVAAGVLALLGKHTTTKIYFFNHASHFPSLGMHFADIILEGTPSTRRITERCRNLQNCYTIGLQSKAKEETVYYSAEEKNKTRIDFGVPPEASFTMSGGAGYKFFDDSQASAYFSMVKELLRARKNLHHLVITNLSPKQSQVVEDIFSDDEAARSRLHFCPFMASFDLVFQTADVFIDSFPISSALTQIDLMRNKVASVVKVNPEDEVYTFHEYLPKDYPCMFENIADMKASILDLLDCPPKREELGKALYQHYLLTYEESIGRDKYMFLIDKKDVLKSLFATSARLGE